LKHKLLLAGLGWGGMPEPMVRADIESGRLVRLDLRDWRGGEYLMQVVHRIETPPGPAGRWLIERLPPSSAMSASSRSRPQARRLPARRRTAAGDAAKRA
jgi:DNA-binding transcriptional LysR family regulator